MKSIVCNAFAPVETLMWKEIENPSPGPGEVLVSLEAAAANFPDALIVEGRYQLRPALPFTPGCEGCGEILAIGVGVVGLDPGDRVMFSTPFGAFAEQVVVEASNVFRIDADMPADDAAGFLLAYATAYHALKQRGALKSGETLLVLGAGGGVGLAAVELGRAMGARVVAAASSAEKLLACADRGAEALIQYDNPARLRAQIAEATDGRGPDVVYDPVGGDMAEPAFRSIAYNGRYVVIGFAAGSIPSLPFNLPLLKSASIVGAIAGIFMVKEPDAHRQNVGELLDFYREGRLKPTIGARFALEHAARAIRWLADRKAIGKIILDPRIDAITQ
ncbi:Quinone oxidoreductase [Sphingobium indicum BiD32]|uniref:Quinone oxidoreductase n=1 Tax=Sphingobium indicum BiD32 TaxID=1301087 RepID=N1MJF5_9SPHN|nr:NADPH:quinone oxidoreductase family protein [Sphingobium indicum]CCW17086.1 Quinone oxidoreductase [Sphingobium indicum BiD32]